MVLIDFTGPSSFSLWKSLVEITFSPAGFSDVLPSHRTLFPRLASHRVLEQLTESSCDWVLNVLYKSLFLPSCVCVCVFLAFSVMAQVVMGAAWLAAWGPFHLWTDSRRVFFERQHCLFAFLCVISCHFSSHVTIDGTMARRIVTMAPQINPGGRVLMDGTQSLTTRPTRKPLMKQAVAAEMGRG